MGLLGNIIHKILVGGHSYRYTPGSKDAPVQRCYGSLPTAGPSDNGCGWEDKGGGVYERGRVYVGNIHDVVSPKEAKNWQEVNPGVWVEK